MEACTEKTQFCSWLASNDLSPRHDNTLHLYIKSLYWAITTMTSVGYGDITPLTNLGRIIASSLMIMGIGFIATITAAISSYFISSFSDKEMTINELGEKLDKLELEIQNLKKDFNDK